MSSKPSVVDPTFGTYKTHEMIKGVGPIPTPLEFWVIFYGSEWTSDSTQSDNRLVFSFEIERMFDTNYFDTAIQYPYLKRPTLGGIVVDDSHELPDNWTDTDLITAVNNSVAAGLVPSNSNAPPGVTYAHYIIPPPDKHCVIDAGGFHFGLPVTASGKTYNLIVGVTLTDIMYGSADAVGVDIADAMMAVFAHEGIEMVTDPVTSRGIGTSGSEIGWTANPNGSLSKIIKQMGDEIADVCENLPQFGTNVISPSNLNLAWYWSDKDGKCIIPIVKPTWITCPAGYIWNNSIQRCILTTGPPPTDISPAPPGSGDTATSDGIPPNPVLATKQTHNVGFGGGPIFNPLEIYIIFAGPTFSTGGSDAATHDKLVTDITTLFQSPFFDNLIQYGLMKRPVLKDIVITTGTAAGDLLVNGFDNAALISYILNTQGHETVPSNSTTTTGKKNIAYLIITKPGIVSSLGIQYNAADLIFSNTWNIYSTATVNATDYTVTTATISKALIDMVINPIPYQGYSMISTTPGYSSTTRDLATICSTVKTVEGITVVNYWSDQDGACISSSTETPQWLTCKAGYAWNPETQTCDPAASGDPGSGGGGGSGSGSGGGTSGGSGPTGYSGGGISPPDPPINTGNEIHDLCAGTVESKGFINLGSDEEKVAVVSLYSDEDGTCLVPNSKPSWITCPAGSKWDDNLQECVLDSSRTSDQTEGDTDTGSGPGSGAGGTGDIVETPSLISYSRDWTFRLDVGVNSDDLCTVGNPQETRKPSDIYSVEPGKLIKSVQDLGYSFGNGITEIGAYITSTDSILYNEVIKQVDVKSIRRVIDETDTGPLGFISCYIINLATKQIETSLGYSINVASLDINEQTISFDASENTYPLKVGDMVIIWYWDATCTVDRCLRLRVSDQNYIDGMNSYLVVRSASGYFGNPNSDPPFTIYV